MLKNSKNLRTVFDRIFLKNMFWKNRKEYISFFNINHDKCHFFSFTRKTKIHSDT
jgi:hypothetical protein